MEHVDIFILGPFWAPLCDEYIPDEIWRRYLMYIKHRQNIGGLV